MAEQVDPFDATEELLFVHAPLDRRPDAGTLDLARLEHHVTVGKHGRSPQRPEMRDDIEGVRV